MKSLADLFASEGLGVLATSSHDGTVNTAVYSRPHVIDQTTLAWGMTEGRTVANIRQNPHASFLFRQGSHGYVGVRITLDLLRIEEEGTMLALVRARTAEVVSTAAAAAVRYVAHFAVKEIRTLV